MNVRIVWNKQLGKILEDNSKNQQKYTDIKAQYICFTHTKVT